MKKKTASKSNKTADRPARRKGMKVKSGLKAGPRGCAACGYSQISPIEEVSQTVQFYGR